MNIIEAVKSGGDFRRPGRVWLTDYTVITLSRENILATDWEVRERKIEISESEFDYIINHLPFSVSEKLQDELKKRLFKCK